jgi:hypothetical protein
VIKKATRKTKDSSTLIDVILTNNPASIVTTEVLPLSISDHDMIACSRKINNKRFKPKTVYARNYTNYNHNALCNDLRNNDWTEFYKQTNVNSAWKILKDNLCYAFNTHAPLILKTVKGKFCPWITPVIKQNLNQRDRILRKARKTGKENDWSTYKRLRNSCNNQIKCAKYKYNKNLLSENSENPKKFWKALKDIIPTKPTSDSAVTSTIKSENEQSSDSISKADVFCKYFSTVAKSLKKLAMPLKDCTWNYIKPLHRVTNEIFQFKYVSNVEVQKELKKLKRNKSAGIDNLPPNLLRDSAEAISTHLTHLINMSLSKGIFPDEWKTAKIVPIHKGEKREIAGNYRPISLLPIVSKLMEKMVHRQLITYLEKNNLLTNIQFGYRASRSTELATTLLLDSIRKEMDAGKLVGTLYIDLSKAFDTVGHAVLLSKLPSYGIEGIELCWITDYLFNRKQHVFYEGVLSECQSVTCGVPQGSVLGPLLFLLYFNDFSKCLKRSKTLMFADDTVVYCADKDPNNIERDLNEDLESIAQYFYTNDLIINLKKGKTEFMLLGTNKRLSKVDKELNLYYRDTKINTTKSYKYLGTYLDNTLSLNEDFEKSYKRGSSRLRLLHKLRKNLTEDAAHKVYSMMILPLVTYCSLVHLKLTATQSKKLQSLQHRASTIISNNKTEAESPINFMKKHACMTVKKCLDNELCINYHDYFEINHQTTVRTRNQGFLLKIRKIKLESTKKAFYFGGAKIFNELPLYIRRENNFNNFKKKISSFYQ